jgi:hypothetical protein
MIYDYLHGCNASSTGIQQYARTGSCSVLMGILFRIEMNSYIYLFLSVTTVTPVMAFNIMSVNSYVDRTYVPSHTVTPSPDKGPGP